MPYSLVIVESPAKCKKIESFLGADYKCMASYGHLRELKNLQSIDIQNDFAPTFHITENKKQQITKLRTAIKGATDVILAADDDREGEAIAWHICQIFNLPLDKTKRIIFHEITKTALQHAIQNMTTLNLNVVYAQQARQILDLIVGFKLSPILWNKISYKTKAGLSAGRCQTPALRLIYENQTDIDKSPGKKVYQTQGYFTANNILFSLQHNFISEETMEKFLVESVNHDHLYTYGKVRATTKKPPTPFTTSGLQQMASNELHFSPKITMSLCQKLYEGGFITYMRTDSKTYSRDFVSKIQKIIEKTYGENYKCKDITLLTERSGGSESKKKKSKDVKAQEAHEAIRPTNMLTKKIPETLGKQEMRLYSLIWRNTMESCMAEAKYNGITATITAPHDNEYRYSTEQVNFPGWKIVAGYETENQDFHYIQTLKKGSVVEYKKITAKVSMKELKTHYTEAKLVQLLEQKGIGRPSTFSSLVDKIQERNYVKKMNVDGKKHRCVDYELEDDEISEIETERVFGNEKNKLVVQPLGVVVIEFLLQHFDDLFQYDYTKHMEDELDNIAKGNKIWHTLCDKCYTEITELSRDLGCVDKQQIKIDDKHTFMIGKYGPIIKCTQDNAKIVFKCVKQDIDLARLRNGEYDIHDIVVEKQNKDNKLGEYKQKDVIVKEGKYGKYVCYDGKNTSLTGLEDITLENVIKVMEENKEKKSSVIRTIDEFASVRHGKYGDYVYYKKPHWKKPQFIKLYSFIKEHGKDSYKSCDLRKLKTWLEKQ